jgi:oligoendopeptidase F
MMDRLQALYGSESEWEAEGEALQMKADLFTSYQGRMLESASTLLVGLREYEQLAAEVERLYVYAQLAGEVLGQSEQAAQILAQAEEVMFSVQEQTSFAIWELHEMTDDLFEAYCEEEPALAPYQYFFRSLTREYVPAPEVEEVVMSLERVGKDFESVYRTLMLRDMAYPEVRDRAGQTIPFTLLNYRTFLRKEEDRGSRRMIYRAIYDTFAQFSATLANTYKGYVQVEVMLAQTRQHDSVFDAVLRRDGMTRESYSTLVAAVEKQLPLQHRFYEMRRHALGLQELYLYDLYVPLVEELDLLYSVEDAIEIIVESVAPLGELYQLRVREAFVRVINEPQIAAEYTINAYSARPYVVVNYQQKLFHLVTLAHELGHAMHMMYSNESVSFVYSEIPTVPSEVAAFVHELLLFRYLIASSKSKREEEYLAHQLLDKHFYHLFRGTMLSEFERRVFEKAETGMALTGSAIKGLYGELQRLYYGPCFAEDDISGMDWVRIQHLYSCFYIYAYPIAFAGAVDVVDSLVTGKLQATDYLAFLSAGHAQDTTSLLALVGVDVANGEFYQKSFEKVTSLLEGVDTCLWK